MSTLRGSGELLALGLPKALYRAVSWNGVKTRARLLELCSWSDAKLYSQDRFGRTVIKYLRAWQAQQPEFSTTKKER